MEPDVIPLPSYSPPPLDGGSEEEEFGDFSTGGVCATIVHAGQTEPTSFFRQTSPMEKPSTALPNPAEETHHPPSEESRNHDSESNLHTGEDRLSETFGSSIASSSLGETGFADFTFFTEQVGHPWCCGFTEEWDGKVEEQDCDSSREVITEPRSQHVPKANRGVRVERKHCDRNAAVQNHRQSQEDEANIRAPCHDGPSLEGDSADLEPNVLSLTSQNGQTDDETEVVEVCLINSSTAKTDAPHCNATQGTSATSCQQHSGTHSQDKCADSADVNMERHREPVETADTGVRSLGSLPPSDSFADFCSAPGRDDEEGPSWANFTEEMWTQLREPEEESEQDGETRMERCQASASCSLQRLLRSSFPEVFVPVVEAEEDLPNLGALLHVQHCAETEEGTPELRPSLRIQQLMLNPHEDIHASLSLQFKWGGSHSNMTLLRCLGVDPRNIVSLHQEGLYSDPAEPMGVNEDVLFLL
ncbi:PREDICTED: uncharacterized protein LOC107095750 [Cyprinodon variegatus]|uniref:uncharacterized protein LOC107095750 n=1 Tax=Cyprinodon variegatus TaxID=28743 RepID=UPI0007425073|nr:PREDICTED: uncharacterized protein LOC107095750 [Cyprinodon variegatus]